MIHFLCKLNLVNSTRNVCVKYPATLKASFYMFPRQQYTHILYFCSSTKLKCVLIKIAQRSRRTKQSK